MRKISRTGFANGEHDAFDVERSDPRPRRIPGAIVTSWHGSPEIDLDALFAKGAPLSASVAGGASANGNRTGRGTVALSDGTRITFAESC